MENATCRLLFVSDCHGNTLQYAKIFQYVDQNNISILLIGGDVSPKPAEDDDYPRLHERQADWINNELKPLLKSASCRVSQFISKHSISIIGNQMLHNFRKWRCQCKFKALQRIRKRKSYKNYS